MSPEEIKANLDAGRFLIDVRKTAREKAFQGLADLRMLTAGAGFGKGELYIWAKAAKIARFSLWQSHSGWTRLEADGKYELDWNLPIFEDRSTLDGTLTSDDYAAAAALTAFDVWLLSRIAALKETVDTAARCPSTRLGTRKERSLANRSLWLYRAELSLLDRATVGEWRHPTR